MPMQAIENLLNTQITLLILILCGYVLTKIKIMNREFRLALTDLIINFVLPCNIIKSFMIDFNGDIFRACLAIFVISAVTQVVTWLLGKLLYSRAQEGRKAPLQYGTMVSNAAFLGNPIVEGLYGAQGPLYASIYLIPQRVMMWSAGISCFTGTRGQGVLKKVLTHPCIVAVGIGLILMVTGLSLPAWADKSLGMVGGCNTALSLIVIGSILAELDPRSLINRDSLGYCLLRLAVIPVLVFAGCCLFGADKLVTQTATILAGMPAPIIAAMLSSKYGKDEQFAVSLVFLSTVVSMVSIPVLSLLMMGL